MSYRKFKGTLCITDLIEKLQSGKFWGFTSDKNGKSYVGIEVFANEEPDQYGNSCTIRLSLKKEFFEDAVAKKAQYIANLKDDTPQQQQTKQEEKQSKSFGDIEFKSPF